MDVQRYRYVALSGGGMLGRLHLGMKQALDEYIVERHGVGADTAWWDALKGVIGCSAGSLLGLCLLLHLPDDTLDEIGRMSCQRHYVLKQPDLGTLTGSYGLDDASGLYDMVTFILTKGGLSCNITFRELRRYVRKDFVVVATNVERAEKLYLSAETAPDMEVREAVVASCRLPLVYAPVRIREGMTLCDGGLCECQPVYFPIEETLNWTHSYSFRSGFTFDDVEVRRSPIIYATALFQTIGEHQFQKFDPRHTLYSLLPGMEDTVETFSFDDCDHDSFLDTRRTVRWFVADQLRGKPVIRSIGVVALIVVRVAAPLIECGRGGSPDRWWRREGRV